MEVKLLSDTQPPISVGDLVFPEGITQLMRRFRFDMIVHVVDYKKDVIYVSMEIVPSQQKRETFDPEDVRREQEMNPLISIQQEND